MLVVRLICYWFVFILLLYPVYDLIHVYVKEEQRIMLVYSWSSVSFILAFILALLMGVSNEVYGMLKNKFEEK